MSLNVFGYLLWIPFLLVFLCTAIPFCMKGYEKGILHALFSTAATLVAAFVSFFAAKLLAPLAVSSVIDALPDLPKGIMDILGDMVPMLLEGFVTSLLAMIIFVVLLVILTVICKILFALIPKPKAKSTVPRLLGLVLRFADAAILTILLLLPLYGTIATYGPAIDATITLQEQPSREVLTVQSFVRCATNHPAVSLAKIPPFSAIYSELSSTKIAGNTVNIPQMTQAVTQTANTIQAMVRGELTAEDLKAFTELQMDIADTDWFYATFRSLTDAVIADMEELGEDASPYIVAMQSLTELSQEAFAQSYTGLVEWMTFASEQGLFQALEDGTFNSEWLEQSGIVEKAMEIQENLPEEFPLAELVDQFFAELAE